ncbi:MAG: DUF1491 family protein [Devosia nanyangense]|uniref:DUF1491 family protein n=1 Tax=Devosia nanyangense TaxID=1228055 RepID=A0A933L690_9HYPH|nr:DUF1491 family protein [Devosia nanyangense]
MLRSDLWAAAFVRRHNDIGHICVVSRKGDPIAGQIFIEIDHLNGTVSLLTPAASSARLDGDEDHLFVRRFDHGEPEAVKQRIAREVDFDPDLWVLSLEMRGDDPGVMMGRG